MGAKPPTTLKVDRRSSSEVSPTVEETLKRWEQQRGLRYGHREATYASVPITSGRAFANWFRSVGRTLTKGTDEYNASLRAFVILPNVQHAAAFIELLRWRSGGLVIDPTAVDVPGWDQDKYNSFWRLVIERHVRRVVFLNGWEHSNGCTMEFEVAQRLFLDCVDEGLEHLSLARGASLLATAISERDELRLDTTALSATHRRLRALSPEVEAGSERRLFKDASLDPPAQTANVAQFVSFGPRPKVAQRFARLRGLQSNHRFQSVEEAAEALLSRSPGDSSTFVRTGRIGPKAIRLNDV